MSKPRPIHSAPRLLRETPDEAEPSYSYEAETFLGREEDDVEDEFHRRLASNSRAREGNNATTGGASGSFWRTDMAPNWGEQSSGGGQILPRIKPKEPAERKVSGGLLGAALQLQSQSQPHSQYDDVNNSAVSAISSAYISCFVSFL